jgi:hypothetical protein
VRAALLVAVVAAGCDPPSECARYCAGVMAHCTGTEDGDGGVRGMQQYTTLANCLGACRAFAVGTSRDVNGNTLGCRMHHLAFTQLQPEWACPHAGPGGGITCGDDCDGYCRLAAAFCAGRYRDGDDCLAQCHALPNDVTYNVSVTRGAHVACLVYHAEEAATDPTACARLSECRQ